MNRNSLLVSGLALVTVAMTGYTSKPANAADRVVVVEMFTATW